MNIMNALTRMDPRTMISDLVQDTVQRMTGREELGKLAGIFVDLKTGNYLGALGRKADLAFSSASDFEVRAELKWGPGAHLIICGNPAAVAESCPGPGKDISVEFSYGFGLFGWSVSFSFGNGGGCEPPPAASPEMRSILDDPSLSLEAKVALLFAQIIDDLDSQVDGKLRALEDSSRAQELDKADGGDGEAAANDFNRISTEVQMLMQKRSQMYGLQSNMMSMFNDVSMQIISNVR